MTSYHASRAAAVRAADHAYALGVMVSIARAWRNGRKVWRVIPAR